MVGKVKKVVWRNQAFENYMFVFDPAVYHTGFSAVSRRFNNMFTLAAHETMFVRLNESSTPCKPTVPPACSPAPPPPPPPPSPPPPSRPLPPCPAGFTLHASGYWANPDQKGSTGHGKNVTACGAFCLSKAGCAAYEVYDPWQVTEPISSGGSAC